MRLRWPVVALAFALAAAGVAGDERVDAKKPERPSVLLVTLDTTRADHLGCYGVEGAQTPNLDSLARSGVRFERALSPAPLTLPSHATLLTGLVPRRHGVRDNAGFRLKGDVPVLAERFRAAGYATAAFVSAAVLDRRVGLSRGFDTYDDSVRVGDRSAFNYEERAASQTTRAAIDGLETLEPPFFLWVHYFDPHLPYVPPEPFRSRFEGRPYDGEIAFMDHEVGRLLDAARRKAEPLFVVVAGDHGESLGEHGEQAHGVFVYQSTQSVPLIMSGPGLPAGMVSRDDVGLVDVAPTILDLVRLPPLDGADGRSVMPLEGRKRDPVAYELETLFPGFSYGWSPLHALVRGDLKYIDAPRPELYDLDEDPREARNLAGERERDAKVLAEALARIVGDDTAAPRSADPDLAELRRRLEALGYVGGTGGARTDEPVDPKDGVVWLGDLDSGRRALQTGDPRDGIIPLRRLLSRNPENVPALLTLGLCQLHAGNVDRAIELYRRALEINPDNEIAQLNLANALYRKNPRLIAGPRSAFERALALNPRCAEAYLSYASMLVANHKPAGAEALLTRARKAGVRDPDVETELGLLAMLRGDVGDARVAFENAVALNDRAPRALEGLGQIAYAGNDYALAADYYARALESRPTTHLARTLGSIRLYKLGDRAGARRAFLKALELSPPGDPEIETLREILTELSER